MRQMWLLVQEEINSKLYDIRIPIVGDSMKSKEEIDREIGEAIHYPECWDTMAYPTLSAALWEMIEWRNKTTICPQCKNIMEVTFDG